VTEPVRYARNDGYLGLALQSAFGTAATASTHFIKYSGAPTNTPSQDFTRYNEGGDGQYPGIAVKHLHRPDGSFELFARPKVSGLLFGLLLGDHAKTGETAPFTHTIVPCDDPADLPWATIERSVAGVLVNRISDARIQRITVTGEAGQPITLNVAYLGINEGREETAQEATYEANDPFIFWQGTYTVDGSDISSKVNRFSLEISNIFAETDQTHEHIRAYLPLIRRDISLSWNMKFNALAQYAKTYLGGATGTTASDLIAKSSGAFIVDLAYGETTGARGLKIEIPAIYMTAAPVELDPGSNDSQEYACEGFARKASESELVTVTVKNDEDEDYAPTS